MVKYHCEICRREFSTAGGLTQHANAKHNGRTTLSQSSSTQPRQRSEYVARSDYVLTRPEHNEDL